MKQTLVTLAFHAYALGALAYVVYLVRPAQWMAWSARLCTGLGLVLQGTALAIALKAQGGVLNGLGQGTAAVTFLLLCIYLAVDLFYRVPVIGAFLTPMAMAVWAPGLWWQGGREGLTDAVRQPLLPVHISIALIGIAACSAAAGVGGVYLLMERQMKGKRFGLLFARLPSLQVLDELNRRLVLAGFVALSLTLISGAFFTRPGGPFWAWHAKEVATLAAWTVFALLLNGRRISGWRGRRAALWTMVGFCIVLISLVSAFGSQAVVR